MSARLALGLAALAAAAAAPLVAGQHLLTAFIVALHAAYMALAWNVAAGYAGGVKVWEVETGQLVFTIPGD